MLTAVDVTVEPGELLGLVGENGAGKSTLARIISGAHPPNRGQILINGQPVALKTPQDAMDHGIQVIYQEFLNNVFLQLNVAENLFTKDETGHFGRAFVNKRRMNREAKQSLNEIGLDIDPTTSAGSLSVAELQMVEIAKSINSDMRLLILDEPTAALDEQESAQLFRQIRLLQQQGISIVYISHRLEEVFDLSDRILVLRNGSVVKESPTSQITEHEVVTSMVGRSVDDLYPKEDHRTDNVALSLTDVTSPGRFSNVSFSVFAGEVLGIGGVMGSGKGAVLRSLFGLLPITDGKVKFDGADVTIDTPLEAIDNQIAYIPPDRQAEGLCLQQSVTHNLSLASLKRFSLLGFVRRRNEGRDTQRTVDELQIQAASVDMEVAQLSGGNQQKVVFGRSTMTQPRVLLMEEPTRGVDIGAKVELYRIINAQAAGGAAVVLVSSDIPELVEMSDRLLVMREGAIVAELTGSDINQQNLLETALESES